MQPDPVPRSPYYDSPDQTHTQLESIARRLWPVWHAARGSLSYQDPRRQWAELLLLTAKTDLQAAQHYGDLNLRDIERILARLRTWMDEGRTLGVVVERSITIDWRPRPDGQVDLLVERNGVPWKTEICATSADARRRMETMRDELRAAGWT
jgi:hypothetical protein